MFVSDPRGGQIGVKMRIHVINRDVDARRWREMQAVFSDHKLQRFSAIDASDPATDVWADPLVKETRASRKGAVGCFLSHLALWRRIAEEGPALVLEDDTTPIGDRDAFKTIWRARRDFDLIFVNQRMARRRSQAPDDDGGLLRSVDASYRSTRLAASEAEKKPSPPGTDGYLLSKKGAKRLLKEIAVDGVRCHVDHWLFFLSVAGATMEQVTPDRLMARMRKRFEPRDNPLNAVAASPALVGFRRRSGPSVRRKIDVSYKDPERPAGHPRES